MVFSGDVSDDLIRRIDHFVSSENAGTITGKRRMGADALMDLVAERLAVRCNVIRLKDIENPIGHIMNNMDGEAENCILIYDVVSDNLIDKILEEFEGAAVYRAQELCHQVPACVRESHGSISHRPRICGNWNGS